MAGLLFNKSLYLNRKGFPFEAMKPLFVLFLLGLTLLLSSGVQPVFAVDRPAGTFIINSNRAVTSSRNVHLNIISFTGENFSMRFSNNGVAWSDWEPIKSTKTWKLKARDGVKTVYLQIKDFAGVVSEPVSDKIILRTAVKATKLTISVKPRVVVLGKKVRIKGKLRDTSGHGIGRKIINIKAGKKTIRRVPTRSRGGFKVRIKPTKKKTRYRAVFVGVVGYKPSRSRRVTVKAR